MLNKNEFVNESLELSHELMELYATEAKHQVVRLIKNQTSQNSQAEWSDQNRVKQVCKVKSDT